MHILKSLVLGSALLASASAMAVTPREQATGEARLAKILDGRVAGQPVDCIDLHNVDSTEIVDGTAIVYHDGPRLYVNRPENGLDQLDDDSILLTRTFSTELCNVDTVHLIDRTSRFERGFVGLGRFVPYTRPKRS
jgi:hypothetical protein